MTPVSTSAIPRTVYTSIVLESRGDFPISWSAIRARPASPKVTPTHAIPTASTAARETVDISNIVQTFKK